MVPLQEKYYSLKKIPSSLKFQYNDDKTDKNTLISKKLQFTKTAKIGDDGYYEFTYKDNDNDDDLKIIYVNPDDFNDTNFIIKVDGGKKFSRKASRKNQTRRRRRTNRRRRHH
jgi:hypothetical protein